MEDPVYLSDEHVLDKMLASEARQVLTCSYFESNYNTSNCCQQLQTTKTNNNNTCINCKNSDKQIMQQYCCCCSELQEDTLNNNIEPQQNQKQDFSEEDRKILAIWMRDVCDAKYCQPDVFPLSVLIVDKFLSIVRTKKSQLQLLGAVALMLASKLRQTEQIPARLLVYFTFDSITMQELLSWELFVLTTLKWDLSFVTPVDYLDIFIRRLKLNDEQVVREIEADALQMIVQCIIDFQYSLVRPSVIAWACLRRAMERYELSEAYVELAANRRPRTALARANLHSNYHNVSPISRYLLQSSPTSLTTPTPQQEMLHDVSVI